MSVDVVPFMIKFGKQKFEFTLPGASHVKEVKSRVCEHFNLEPDSLKFIPLTGGITKFNDDTMSLEAACKKQFGRKIKLLAVGTDAGMTNHIAENDNKLAATLIVEEEQRVIEAAKEVERENARVREEARQRALQEQQRKEQAERQRLEQIRQKEQRIREAKEREHVTFELPVFQIPAASTHSGNSASSPNPVIVLPQECLTTIIDRKLKFPLTFEISVPDGGKQSTAPSSAMEDEADDTAMDTSPDGDGEEKQLRTVYAKVLEFDAPSGQVHGTSKLLTALGVTEGTILKIRNINLKNATFVQLSSSDPRWLDIEEQERKALLEFELRKSHFLVAGTEMTLSYNMRSYPMTVAVTKPEQVVAITDTDLTLDIVINSDIVTEEELHGLDLKEGEQIDLKLATGEDFRMQFATIAAAINDSETMRMDMQKMLQITLGQDDSADLYVTTNPFQPPSASNFEWCQQEGKSVLQIPFVRGTTYFIAAVAFDQNVATSLQVDLVDTTAMSNGNSASVTTDDTTNKSQCPHCHKYIPTSALTMHEMRCAKLNVICPFAHCGQVLATKAKAKHDALVHKQYTCECGEHFDQLALQTHRQDECMLTLVPCVYCFLRVNRVDRGPHQQICGNRPCMCLENGCGAQLKKKELKRHLWNKHYLEMTDVHKAW